MMDYAEDITAERVRRVMDGYGAVEGAGGSFSFYELGEPLLIDGEYLNESGGVEKIREYIWFTETKLPYIEQKQNNPYYLGAANDTAFYFYYEKDRMTTLDYAFLAELEGKADGYVIYAAKNAVSDADLTRLGITFKKIPRDISRL